MITAERDDLVARWPAEDRLRYMLQDGATGPRSVALLHHTCEHANVRGILRETDWYACQRETPLDNDVVFDTYCDVCFERYCEYMGML